MNRRSLLLTLALAFLTLTAVGALLHYLIRYERPWYARVAVPPGERRARLSQEFYTEFFEWLSTFQGEKEWYAQFTDEQVNSYLDEEFVKSGLHSRLLPEGVAGPRIAFEQDKIRIGFRYDFGLGRTLLTLDLRAWIPHGDENSVALELVGLHAGALPIKAQTLLEQIAQIGRDNGMEINWYRYNNHPVALIHFQPEQQRPSMQLQRIELKPGSIMIRGCLPTDDSRAAAGR